MINRDSWGHPYSVVRGEILGFTEDELLRKHLPKMFSLISERKLGDRRRFTLKRRRVYSACCHRPRLGHVLSVSGRRK